jgi:PH (Pleckstrin Homology) domain-containing protein
VTTPSAPAAPVVIRIAPIAHFASGFVALGLLAFAPAFPAVFGPLLIIPILLSVAIWRYRTVADAQHVTARTLLSSESIDWADIDGLRFGPGTGAYAQRKDGSEIRLPAVTFATLPQLAAVSGGRVPNPYA